MDNAALRDDMVDGLEYSLGRPLGERTLDAMRSVPRHEFVSAGPYQNRTGEEAGSRVLAPVVVARLLSALQPEPGDDVLVVGAGVGYTVGALAEIVGARHVHAVDIDRELVYMARSNLDDAGYGAAFVDCRDGARGFPEYAPYDRILMEAAAVEAPQALLDQLTPDGRLVMPRGTGSQSLVSIGSPEDTDVAAESDGGMSGLTGDSHSGSESEPTQPTDQSTTRNSYQQLDTHGPVQFRPLLVEGERNKGPARNRTVREDAEIEEQGHFADAGWEQEWIDWDDQL
ncbi:MAG: protein-L-isoaspartate carboxylmethyltransferase [uncultured archaeon A07HR60]|nr:MAG: protein-L-isoaspartate carboxylmethyltransferase [uncultured archaeon A07HR60]